MMDDWGWVSMLLFGLLVAVVLLLAHIESR